MRCLEDIGERLTRKYIRTKAPYEYDGGYAFLFGTIVAGIIWGSTFILRQYLILQKGSVADVLFVLSGSMLGLCISIPIGIMFEKTNPFYLAWLGIKSVLLKLGSTK